MNDEKLQAIDERLKTVEKFANKKTECFEIRITNLERRTDVVDERFNQVFDKLDSIIKILNDKNTKLPNLMWTVGGIILGSVISGVILWTIK